MQVPDGQVPSVLANLRSDPVVSSASVAQPVHAAATPDDPVLRVRLPGFGRLRGYGNLEPGLSQGDRGSSGVGRHPRRRREGRRARQRRDAAHPDLQGKIVAQHDSASTTTPSAPVQATASVTAPT